MDSDALVKEKTRKTLQAWTDCMKMIHEVVTHIVDKDSENVVLGLFGPKISSTRYRKDKKGNVLILDIVCSASVSGIKIKLIEFSTTVDFADANLKVKIIKELEDGAKYRFLLMLSILHITGCIYIFFDWIAITLKTLIQTFCDDESPSAGLASWSWLKTNSGGQHELGRGRLPCDRM